MRTVQNRVYQAINSSPPPVLKHGQISPLEQVEEWAVKLLIKCGEMNQPLTCDQGLKLIRSLVDKDGLREEIYK